ncbi:MAG: 3-phosphoshikimate 1-carboxyvinyltransferase [Flavobacterium sp.]
MDVRVSLPGQLAAGKTIAIGGSKSETNRLLLLQALYPSLKISNASDSDDSNVMRKALSTESHIVDVHHAGTAMRFLTAYFAQQEGREVVITGSSRMTQRPIGVLVDALKTLGTEIVYLKNEGYPPLKISGKKLTGGIVTIDANVSSQYITALLLIAPKLENGLGLYLNGEITSRPYLEMTISLLQELGISVDFDENTITVAPKSEIKNKKSEIIVESDWSSASYYYSIVALSEFGASVRLTSYKQNSLQGDSELAEIYKAFGVETTFAGTAITLTKTHNPQPATLNLQLNNTPDIAQTIAVTRFGQGLGCHLTGLHTLRIKETDRLSALKTELEKCGANITITNDRLTLSSSLKINPDVEVETYNDHRMAMAFAPLAVKVPIIIKDAGVVSKSYPAFWDNLKAIGFVIETI